MKTVAFQRRDDELAEKQPKLHPETYQDLKDRVDETDGFTISNIVNEALSYFLGVGEIVRSIEIVEGRVRGVAPLPPFARCEIRKNKKSVEAEEKDWSEMYNVPTYREWKDADKGDTKIYLNTNNEIWSTAKDTRGRVGYVVTVAVRIWLSCPFDGVCNRMLSYQQMLNASEGKSVPPNEATGWVDRRLRQLRPQSDGEYHEEWESLFSESAVGLGDLRLPQDNRVEIEREKAVRASEDGELDDTWKNRVAILMGVCRSEAPDGKTDWERSEVEEVNDVVNDDVSPPSRRKYVDEALKRLNETKVRMPPVRSTLPKKVEEVEPMDEYYDSMAQLRNALYDQLKLLFDVHTYMDSYGLGTGERDVVVTYAANLIREAPKEAWEGITPAVEKQFENYQPGRKVADALNEATPAEV